MEEEFPVYPAKQLSDSLCRCFLVLLSILSSQAVRNKGEVSLALPPLRLFFFLFFNASPQEREVERFVLLANNLIAPRRAPSE